ncbi:MAG TPA: hypothetical protein VGP50_01335 [Stellaceae bacterium]|jgi:hypothetical protein|nr:hypothetical protein [Stellaceae bacterium]
MKRRARWAFLLLVPLLLAVAPARADQGGFHQGFQGHPGSFMHQNGRMFFRPGGRVFFRHDARFFNHDRRFFHHRAFFRPFFFFGTGIFAPLPIALFPPPAPPAYLMGQEEGDPSCYDYQMSGQYGGEPPYGAACVEPDGSWQVAPGY